MKQKIFAVLTIAALLLGSAIVAKTAVSTIAGLAVAQSPTTWNSVKDAAVGDNLINGLFAGALYFFDGTDFDRARGDSTFGLDVDVTRMPGSSQTPADGFANPTTFSGAWALNGVLNTAGSWDRMRAAQTTSLSTALTTGIQAQAQYAYDFTGVSQNRYKAITQISNQQLGMTNVTGLFRRITTNTSDYVAMAPAVGMVLQKVLVTVPGVTSTLTIYLEPDGSAPCGGAGSSIVNTVSTIEFGTINYEGLYLAGNLCFLTAGGTPAEVLVMYTTDVE